MFVSPRRLRPGRRRLSKKCRRSDSQHHRTMNMAGIVDSVLDGVDAFLAWMSTSLKQTTESYCDLQTADSPTVLVSHEGGLVSVIKVRGAKALVGNEEFQRIQAGLLQSLQITMYRPGHAVQAYFSYNRDEVGEEIAA